MKAERGATLSAVYTESFEVATESLVQKLVPIRKVARDIERCTHYVIAVELN